MNSNFVFMAKKSDEKKDELLIEYNFPEHSITVLAHNIEEANEKLKKLLNE